MKNRLQLENSNIDWSANGRYKINTVVSHLGVDYQNTSGGNSLPSTLVDWSIIQNNNNVAIKSINTSILPDVNGNAIIPNASVTEAGLVSATQALQTFKGNKIIRGNGNTSNALNSFEVQNNSGVIGIRVAENNWFTCHSNAFFLAFLDMVQVGVDNPARFSREGSKLVIGHQTITANRFNFDLNTGNMCVGQTTSQSTTNEKFEVISNTRGAIPAPRMTLAIRNAITSPTIGSLIMQTDGVAGIYQYTATGWKRMLTEA